MKGYGKIILAVFLVCMACDNQSAQKASTLIKHANEQLLRNLLDSSAYFIAQERYDDAKSILDSARLLAYEVNSDSLLAISLNNTGSLNYWIGNYGRSISYYEKALDIDRVFRDSTGMVIRLKNIGISYKQQGDFESAIKYYQEALEIVKFTNQVAEEASINNSIGNLLNSLDRYERALPFLVLAEDLWLYEGDSLKSTYALGNQGNSFLGLGKIQEAVECHMKALNIKQRIASKTSIAITLNNLGETYSEVGNYNRAIEYFQLSLNLRSEIGEIRGVAIVCQNLANLEIESGRPAKARNWLNRAEEIVNREGIADLKIENLRLKKALFAKTEDYKNAFIASEMYNDLKQSKFNKQVIEVSEQQFQYNLEQEEKEKVAIQGLLLLSQEREKTRIIQSQVQQYIIIAAILAIIIVGYFAYTLRKKNRHIENLIRELHHRVKNHLGMISGMFGAQTGLSIADTAVLDEAKTRVEAVNGIHRRLYRQDEYEYVNMKEYLEELVDNNALVFGLFNKIEKHFEIHEQIMDIDKAISVGLIANEVLTNAFKYGLQDTHEPVLKIVLEKALKGYKMIIFNNAEADKSNGGGFGGELINRLAQNLKGQIQVIKDGGFQFELTFP